MAKILVFDELPDRFSICVPPCKTSALGPTLSTDTMEMKVANAFIMPVMTEDIYGLEEHQSVEHDDIDARKLLEERHENGRS